MLENARILMFPILLLVSSIALGDCISLVKGKIAFDVRTCGRLKPEATFDTSRDEYSFIGGLSKNDQKKFWNSYRGLVLSGKVAKSYAVRSGLNPERGVLSGENIKVFIHPKDSARGCSNINGKRVAAFLEEACCEGGGDPPCLLSSAYVLRNVKVMGKIGARSSAKKKAEARGASYKEAIKQFKAKRYSKAVVYFSRANEEASMDISGLYLWAVAYRKLDRCNKAIGPLNRIAAKQEKKDYWSDDEATIRNANFLLARCYSKLSQPQMAVPILEGYLVDPKRYRKEIKRSLSHPDFGWIKTSKEFVDYRRKAILAVR